jgi:hypothetical protein
MAYKKGGGAAAVAGYGSARRDVAKTEKMWGGIESVWGSVQDIGASIALKKEEADTAWGEYEAGYVALGGDVADIKKPGFFKRTAQQFLPGGKTGLPEGEVRIGGSMYDRSKIQKAGSFLSSDASAVLDQNAIDRYLGRTVPGREIPSTTVSDGKPPIKGEVLDQTSGYDIFHRDVPKAPDDTRSTYTPSRQHTIPGPNVNIDFKSQIKKGFKDLFTNGFTGEGGGTGVKTGKSQIPKDPYSYQNMLTAGTAQELKKGGQVYMDNPENSWLNTWKKNLSKQIKEGADSTTWYNQDDR